MGDLTLGAILQYMVSASFNHFLWVGKGLKFFLPGMVMVERHK